MTELDTTQAAGRILSHDLTRIGSVASGGTFKRTEFRKGHIIEENDIPTLLAMGKEHVLVDDDSDAACGAGCSIGENDAARQLSELCCCSANFGVSENIRAADDPTEGKAELFAAVNGVFCVDAELLLKLNSIGGIAVGVRKKFSAVRAGEKIAACKIIPLSIEKEKINAAESLCKSGALFRVVPFTKTKAAVIVTGSEITKGLIKDAFVPALEKKLAAFDVRIVSVVYTGDDAAAIAGEIEAARRGGAEIILCTGGMSVDSDDKTPGAIKKCGAELVCYGTPVFPGAMFALAYFDNRVVRQPLLSNNILEKDAKREAVCETCSETGIGKPMFSNTKSGFPNKSNGAVVAGLPGCVISSKATIFDILLPRIVAGLRISRDDVLHLADGGLCLSCSECVYPNCQFGK